MLDGPFVCPLEVWSKERFGPEMEQRAQDASPAVTPATSVALAGAWLGLAMVLAASRCWLLLVVQPQAGVARPSVAWLVPALYQDLVFVVGLALLADLALRWTRRPLARHAIGAASFVVAVLAAAYGVLATEVFADLDTPLTWRLLDLSDHLRGVRASLVAELTLARILPLVAAPIFVLLVAAAAHRGPSGRVLQSVATRRVALIAFAAYVVLATLLTRQLGWELVANPHVAMLGSLWAGDRGAPAGAAPGDDVTDLRPRPDAPPRRASPLSGVLTRSNVVLVILESVGAKRLAPWGAVPDAAPELTRIARHGVTFERIYVQQPRSSNAMAALFCSIYPLPRRASVPRREPELAVPGLGDVLLGEGYRTAFLSSGDLSFDGERTFLERHGFASVHDVRDVVQALAPRPAALAPMAPPADASTAVKRSPSERRARRLEKRRAEQAAQRGQPLDRALLPRALDWIAADSSRPFFLALWTIQEHHPYLVEGVEEPLVAGDANLNRYLNALRETDRMLGNLERSLAERGLADSTLIVVTGDHGEAFGEHGVKFHGRSLYDEEVRVPLVLRHPLLDGHAGRVPTVGQQIDLAPTVLDLLGVAVPEAWQGLSLFAADRPGRAYLANVFEDTLLGLVDGDRKYVFDETLAPVALYDVARDPAETDDRSGRAEEQENIARARRRIAGWLGFQEEFLAHLAGGS